MLAPVSKTFALSALLFICNCVGGKTADGSVAQTSSPPAPTTTTAAASRNAKPPASEASPATLIEAVERSAERIIEQLPTGSRVAIVTFGAEHDNISEFIMEELSAALFNGGMMVTERENMEYVKMEVQFQMSGDFDESAIVNIGNLLGADMTVNGNLFNLGDTYRYQTNAIDNRTGSRVASTTVSLPNDGAMRRMIAALALQKRRVRVARDLAAVAQTPETVGGFIDRGVAYAARNDYDSALADFEAALQMDPDNAAAKSHIERIQGKRRR